MKFDIVVGNPPYGSDKKGSNRFLHLQILQSIIKYCNDKIVFIMPSKPIVKKLENKWFNILKNAVCDKIEVIDKGVFKNTEMDNTAIFYCNRHNSPENYCKKLEPEKSLYYSIGDEGRLFIDRMCLFDDIKIFVAYNMHGNKTGSIYFIETIDKISKKMNDKKYYLNVNRANGSFGALWFSNILQKVEILTKNDEIKFCKEHIKTKNILECPNIDYGKNLKNLMLNGLVLRYGLWLTQVKQYIVQDQFKYVPDLDYTNINTDEELLAACGFTDEEIIKMMDYLKHFDFSQNRNDLIRNFEK